jgi:DNA-binding winged helix-turn-helix (wHTH) protein
LPSPPFRPNVADADRHALSTESPRGKEFVKDIRTPGVKIVRWPAESEKLERFRLQRSACLIVVARGARVPELAGAHEDWIREPIEAWELKTRIASLHLKATARKASPVVDEDGILCYGDAVLPLTVCEGVVLRGLIQRRPGMASRAELGKLLLSANRSASQNALDLHIMRLRRKVVPVGLAIETVRGRGFLLKTQTVEVTGSGESGQGTTPVGDDRVGLMPKAVGYAPHG